MPLPPLNVLLANVMYCIMHTVGKENEKQTPLEAYLYFSVLICRTDKNRAMWETSIFLLALHIICYIKF